MLIEKTSGTPDRDLVRRALQGWAYSTAHRDAPRPAKVSEVLVWVEQNTRSIGDLAAPALTRKVLTRITQKKDGTPCAPRSAIKAKHVLSRVLDYAVELRYLDVNPLTQLNWRTPRRYVRVVGNEPSSPTPRRHGH